METSPASLGLGQWWFAWLRVLATCLAGVGHTPIPSHPPPDQPRSAVVYHAWRRFQVALTVFVTAVVEVFRRSLWAAIRIGNEHYNNASAYRVVKEMPSLPLDTAGCLRGDATAEWGKLAFEGALDRGKSAPV